MRLAASIVAALLLAGLCAGCADEPEPRPTSGSTSSTLWKTGTRLPTVTLTEPASGPVRDRS